VTLLLVTSRSGAPGKEKHTRVGETDEHGGIIHQNVPHARFDLQRFPR